MIIPLLGLGLASCTGTPKVEKEDLFFPAVAQSDLQKVKELIATGADVNSTLSNGRTALHLANDPAMIRLLVHSGADAHQQDNRGQSALERIMHSAVLFPFQRESKRSLLSAFLDAGVQFPIEDDEGVYFLHSSAQVGHLALVEHLLNRGVELRSLNQNDGTLLHSSALGGLESLALDLLEKGFDPNARDRYGLTPLHLAAQEGHSGLVHSLVTSGSDTRTPNLAGKLPIDLARDYGHEFSVTALLELNSPVRGATRLDLHGSYLGMKPPGMLPELFAPGIVSSHHYDHSAAIFSANGKHVFWSPVYTSRGDFILSMQETVDGWSTPNVFPFSPIGGTTMYPTLSGDGSTLFFTSDRALPGQESGQEMNIWRSERQDNEWSEPVLVGFPGGNEYGLSIADNGTLVFMADYPGGLGSTDLYRSSIQNGQYSAPENLGPTINSEYYEDEPFMAPDGSYLLFASLRPQEGNPGRLYFSLRNHDQSWSQPQGFSGRFQMSGQFRFPHLSPDAKYLFFANNQTGNWDIYWVDAAILPELLRN